MQAVHPPWRRPSDPLKWLESQSTMAESVSDDSAPAAAEDTARQSGGEWEIIDDKADINNPRTENESAGSPGWRPPPGLTNYQPPGLSLSDGKAAVSMPPARLAQREAGYTYNQSRASGSVGKQQDLRSKCQRVLTYPSKDADKVVPSVAKFAGAWQDTLGNKITVVATKGAAIVEGKSKGSGKSTHKEWRFTSDQYGRMWCGNGTLYQVGYQEGVENPSHIAWRTQDWKISLWTREASVGDVAMKPCASALQPAVAIRKDAG